MEKPSITSQEKINADVKNKLKELEEQVPKNEQETRALLNQFDPNSLAKLPAGKKSIRDVIVKIIDAYSDKVTTKEQKMIISKLDDVRNALNEAIQKTVFTGLKNSMARTYNRMTGRSSGGKKTRTRRRKGGQERNALALQFPNEDEELPFSGEAQGLPVMRNLKNLSELTDSEKITAREEADARRANSLAYRLDNMAQRLEYGMRHTGCSPSRPDRCILKLIYRLLFLAVGLPLGLVWSVGLFVYCGLRVAYPFLLPVRLLILLLMRLFNLSSTGYFKFDGDFASDDSLMQIFAPIPEDNTVNLEPMTNLQFNPPVNSVVLSVNRDGTTANRNDLRPRVIETAEADYPLAEAKYAPENEGGKRRKSIKTRKQKYRSRKSKKQRNKK